MTQESWQFPSRLIYFKIARLFCSCLAAGAGRPQKLQLMLLAVRRAQGALADILFILHLKIMFLGTKPHATMQHAAHQSTFMQFVANLKVMRLQIAGRGVPWSPTVTCCPRAALQWCFKLHRC